MRPRQRLRRGWRPSSEAASSATGVARTAANRSVSARARSSSSRVPGAGNGASGADAEQARADVTGSTREASRRPMWSSSDPAIANGSTGAPVRSAMSAAPTRKVERRAGRTRDAALGEEDEHAAGIDDGARRGEVLVDADPASPDREHAAEAPQQPLLPALVECRGGAAEEPCAWLQRQSVEHEERIHPAAMDRADEQVAAGRAQRDVLLSRPIDPEAEKAEEDQARDRGEGAHDQRRPDLGRAAEPREPLAGVAARGPKGFGGDARLPAAARDAGGPQGLRRRRSRRRPGLSQRAAGEGIVSSAGGTSRAGSPSIAGSAAEAAGAGGTITSSGARGPR